MSDIKNEETPLALCGPYNGCCRVYYKDYSGDSYRLLCYQAIDHSSFELLVCTPSSGEPEYPIKHQNYIKRTPLPIGDTKIEIQFRQWMAEQAELMQ